LQFLNKKEEGFTLIELLVVVVILGISAAITAPSFVNSWRQSQTNLALNQLRLAFQQAQANANRMSTSCQISIAENPNNYTITGSPAGCFSETIIVDRNITDISSTSSAGPPWNVAFTFSSTTFNQQTFTIARRNAGGSVDTSNANCLVISNGIGMIRIGKKDGTTCVNRENLRYPN
jgi:prepilin-type N-terminal cleavage/methylation domain-containing protein